jgi:hypothetical protein
MTLRNWRLGVKATNYYLNHQIMQNISIRVAIENRFLHVIVERNGQSISAGEIAKETSSDLLLTGGQETQRTLRKEERH